jgi:pantoate kinase
MRTLVGRAMAPAHVSGIFVIHQKPKADPMEVGSTGLGFAALPGVEVELTITYSPAARTTKKAGASYKLDRCMLHSEMDRRDYLLPQMKDVVRRLAAAFPPPADAVLKIEARSPLPLSQGLGLSGGAALACGLAYLSAMGKSGDAMGDGIPGGDELLTAAGEAAHGAEVLHRSGLGDVAGQMSGGITLRKRPGLPSPEGTARLKMMEKEAGEASLQVAVMGDPLSTRSILGDPAKSEAINAAGANAMDRLMKEHMDMGLADALDLCWEFAGETGLVPDELSRVVGSLPSGWHGTMSMLGNSVFVAGIGAAPDEPPWNGRPCVKMDLAERGARVIE